MKNTPATATDGSITLRSMIRDVMKAKPERALSYAALFAQLRLMIPDVDTKDVRTALEWNFKRGNVNFEHDHELELDVWKLTTRGLNA